MFLILFAHKTWNKNIIIHTFCQPLFHSLTFCDNVPLQIGNVEVFITEFAKEHVVAGTCSDYGLKPKSGQQMCEKFPERRAWAEHECNVLRSGVFKSCYEAFSDDMASAAYDRCLHDACGCSRGDDCRCLCTNLAVFAKLCSNLKGINLSWRTQELCRKCLYHYAAKH